MVYNNLNIRPGKFGKVFVKYATPISVNKFVETRKSQSLDTIALELTSDLYQVQQSEQPITMNSLISTSLFFHPKQTITFG